MNARVCLGVIVGVKGLRGEVRIKSFTENPADVAAYGPLQTKDGKALAISVVTVTDEVVIAKVAGVADRTAAEALKGLELYVARDALPATGEDTYYHADLVGLAVEDADGTALGKVSAIHNYGGGDVMEVTAVKNDRSGGKTALLPFTADVIAKVDIAGGRVVVTPSPDMFEEGDRTEESGGHGG